MIERLSPLLITAGLGFKYVKNLQVLRRLNAGSYGYSQVGKDLVIYLPAVDVPFIEGLKLALRPYRDQSPAVPCARSFGDRLPLYYRFGSYTGGKLIIDGVEVDDDRKNLANAVPEGIADLIAPFTAPDAREPSVERFLRKYPTVRAIAQQGKCGVFHAIDISCDSLREVLLKVGYFRGQMHMDGRDGCDLLRRELACYELLSRRHIQSLAPELIDSLDLPRKVILVLGYIDGINLLQCKLSGQLTVDLLERAWTITEEFHANGIYLGDVKLANFMMSKDGDLRAVDLESAGEVEKHTSLARTFFVDPQQDDPLAADQAHFLASILYPYGQAGSDWENRHVTLPGLLGQEPESDVSAWALARLGAICG